MTWSAPNERIKSSLPVLSTPVTSAPYFLASCTANVPAPPPAPLIKTFCPGWTCPLSRIPCRRSLPLAGWPLLPRMSYWLVSVPRHLHEHKHTRQNHLGAALCLRRLHHLVE